MSAGTALPDKGAVFISVTERERAEGLDVARKFADLGFKIYATRGTAYALRAAGIECTVGLKVNEGRPNIVDLTKDRRFDLIVNSPAGAQSFQDEKTIRRAAMRYRIPCLTTLSAARAAAEGIAARREHPARVESLQRLHARQTAA